MNDQITKEEYDVAVVGSGPSGLSAAISLKESGVNEILVVEREAVAGGAPRHCGHPPYGVLEYHRIITGPTYAKRLVASAQKAGVKIACNAAVTSLGKKGELHILTPFGKKRIRAKRILLATGAREMAPAARLVSGDRRIGICTTGVLQMMYYLNRTIPFQRPVIVGTEIVSLSALWTCKKAGIKPVAFIEESETTSMPQPFVCAFSSLICGLTPKVNTMILSISGDKRVESVELCIAGNNPEKISCDGILFTGRFVPESSLCRISHLETEPEKGSPVINNRGGCSDSSYYAVGNILPPLNNAVNCWRAGRRIGRIIAKELQ